MSYNSFYVVDYTVQCTLYSIVKIELPGSVAKPQYTDAAPDPATDPGREIDAAPDPTPFYG
jgi:hypothetical protein